MSDSLETSEGVQAVGKQTNKRPRPSEEGVSLLHQKLIDFSKKVVHMKEQLSTYGEGAPFHTRLKSELWCLLIEIEPYLYLCVTEPHPFSRLVTTEPFRTDNPRKNLKHAQLSFRVYIAILQPCSTDVPIMLHSVAVLVSLMPYFSSPDVADGTHTKRYIDALLFCIKSIFKMDPDAGTALVRSLLAENCLSRFRLTRTPESEESYGCCDVMLESSGASQLVVPPIDTDNQDESLLIKNAFHCIVTAATMVEVFNVSYGLCYVFGELLKEPNFTLATPDALGLAKLACSVLTYHDGELTAGFSEAVPYGGEKRFKEDSLFKLHHLSATTSGAISSACSVLTCLVKQEKEDNTVMGFIAQSVLHHCLGLGRAVPREDSAVLLLLQVVQQKRSITETSFWHQPSMVTLLVRIIVKWSVPLLCCDLEKVRTADISEQEESQLKSLNHVVTLVETLHRAVPTFQNLLLDSMYFLTSFSVKRCFSSLLSMRLFYKWHLYDGQRTFFAERIVSLFDHTSLYHLLDDILLEKKASEDVISFFYMKTLSISWIKYLQQVPSTTASEGTSARIHDNVAELVDEFVSLVDNCSSPNLPLLFDAVVVLFHAGGNAPAGLRKKLVEFLPKLKGACVSFANEKDIPDVCWSLVFKELSLSLSLDVDGASIMELWSGLETPRRIPALLGLLEGDAVRLRDSNTLTLSFELYLFRCVKESVASSLATEELLLSFIRLVLLLSSKVISAVSGDKDDLTSSVTISTVVDVDDDSDSPSPLGAELQQTIVQLTAEVKTAFQSNSTGMKELYVRLWCALAVLYPESIGDLSELARYTSGSDHQLIRCVLGPAATFSGVCCSLKLSNGDTLPDLTIGGIVGEASESFSNWKQLEFSRFLLTFGWNNVVESPYIAFTQDIIAQCTHKIYPSYLKWHKEQCLSVIQTCAQATLPSAPFSLYEMVDDILSSLGWSAVDLCRSCPSVATTEFFKMYCESGVREELYEDIILQCLNVLLDGEWRSARPIVGELLDSNRVNTAVIFSAVAASRLFRASTPQEKYTTITQFCKEIGVTTEMIPTTVSSNLASVVLNLISLQGDHRLSNVEFQSALLSERNTGDDDDAPLALAICQAVSLAESGPSREAVEGALSSPVTTAAAGPIIVKSIFDVLDSIMAIITQRRQMSNEESTTQKSVSECTLKRWLLGLSSFVNFLGNNATILAAKLPTIFQICLPFKALLPFVCVVWRDLLFRCSDDYLQEHGPSLVVDTVVMEGLNTSPSDLSVVKQLLFDALKRIYDATHEGDKNFWRSYFVVLAQGSQLIVQLRDSVVGDHTLSKNVSLAEKSRRGSPQKSRGSLTQGSHVNVAISEETRAVVSGFLSVVSSASMKCKSIFVDSFYNYLKRLTPSQRIGLTEAAQNLDEFQVLVPFLLQCTREFPTKKEKLVALNAVGLIGAISPQFLRLSTVVLPGDNEDMPVLSHRQHFLDRNSVIHWRVFALGLLNNYCPRALANTGDKKMHDRAAYAIQELLRVYTKKERKEKGMVDLRPDEILHEGELQRYLWWSQLPDKTKRLLEGFFSTKFKTLIYQYPGRKTPEYKKQMPYEIWVVNWFKNLASRCVGAFGDTMVALRNVGKRDISLATYLIPYMVAHILECGDEEAFGALVCEFDTVFQMALASDSSGPSQGDVQLSLRSLNTVENSQNLSYLVDEHVQLLVNILEDLNQLRWSLLAVRFGVDKLDSEDGCDMDLLMTRVERYKQFMDSVSWVHRALSSLQIGSNIRALRTVECQRYLPSPTEVIRKVPLQRIFAALGDRDSSKTVHHMTHDLPPEEAVFSFENNGEWHLALQNCELVLQHMPNSVPHQLTSLRCMRQLGQLHLMSRYSQALLNRPESRKESLGRLTESDKKTVLWYANEAAWRLGEWDSLDFQQNLPVSLAEPVSNWVRIMDGHGPLDENVATLEKQRWSVVLALHSNCREGYAQSYNFVVLSHALADLEIAGELLGKRGGPLKKADLNELVCVLNKRMESTEFSLEGREPLLSLHRSIYRSVGLDKEVADTWLKNAALLRDAGFYDAAWSAIQQVNISHVSHVDSSYYVMAADLLRDTNNKRQAIDFARLHSQNQKLPAAVRSELKVRTTKWTLEVGSQTPAEVIASFQAALNVYESEDVHYNLARFYDQLYTVASEGSAGRTGSQHTAALFESIKQYAILAVQHYGKALLIGFATVSVSLPRMLTLWFDSSTDLQKMAADTFSPHGNKGDATPDRVLKELNIMMEGYLKGYGNARPIASAILVTALPQLLSRITHNCKDVVLLITKTVVNLMLQFPQPCLWMVLPIAFGKQKARSDVVKTQIISVFKQHEQNQKVLGDAFSIFTSLMELCNAPPANFTGTGKIRKMPFIQRVEKIFPTANFILPTLANLTPSIPAGIHGDDPYTVSTTFHHFDDKVDIMSSLQKPKKIQIHTNEGEEVSFLCKAKDEPRKDIRMMEIAALMNTCFLNDPDAYRRGFALRRYCIAALADDCAMIEWVNKIETLRHVVNNCYLLDGTGARISQVKTWYSKVESKELKKMDMFTQLILPAAPPVLHQWFDRRFTNNQEWFEARKLYTKSTALWSIAGHIVGLGDRHGENLMLDVRTGEMMHVDFACMFDKGETLEVPERVRFRLTQNLIDGMGIIGADGPFQSNCEIALRVQVKSKDAVMSVVETLLYDPLVEWTNTRSHVDPKHLIQRVKRRLDGYLDLFSVPPQRDTLSLNIEGQVSKLISHSSALENLSEMYVWWMAWV